MKKKAIAIIFAAMIAVGAIIPAAVSTVSAASTWNYGFNKTTMEDYNEYLNTGLRHSVSITKKDITWYSGVAQPRYWAKLYLAYNGPYLVKYHKHNL